MQNFCRRVHQCFLSSLMFNVTSIVFVSPTIARLYTNTDSSMFVYKYKYKWWNNWEVWCKHDLSQVFIFWLLLSWTKQTLFKMSKFVKLLSSVWVEKFAFREEHWFLQRVLTPSLTQALDQSSPRISNNNEADYTLSSLKVLSIDVNRYVTADVSVHGAISRCHKIKWHKSPFT